MAVTTTRRPDKTGTETIDGADTTVRQYHNLAEYHCLIEIEREATWIFSIDKSGMATLVETTSANGSPIPDWCRNALYGSGVTEIDA